MEAYRQRNYQWNIKFDNIVVAPVLDSIKNIICLNLEIKTSEIFDRLYTS